MFFIISFYMNLKRHIRLHALFLAGFFCIVVWIGCYIQKEMRLSVSMGVLCESESAAGRSVIEELLESSYVNVIEYDSIYDMTEAVRFGKIEIGYVISEDIERYIVNGSINRGVRVYKTNAAISDGFTNEIVFAALLKEAAPYIAYNYLKGKGENVTAEETYAWVKAYYQDKGRLEFDVTALDDGNIMENNRIVSGIAGVFAFVLFFYITIKGVEEKAKGYYEILRGYKRFVYTWAYCLAGAVFVFLITAVSVPFYGGSGFWHNLWGLFMYVLALGVMCAAGVLLAETPRVYYALFPFVSVAASLLGGAFFDIGKINPYLGGISYLFPTFYFIRYLY